MLEYLAVCTVHAESLLVIPGRRKLDFRPFVIITNHNEIRSQIQTAKMGYCQENKIFLFNFEQFNMHKQRFMNTFSGPSSPIRSSIMTFYCLQLYQGIHVTCTPEISGVTYMDSTLAIILIGGCSFAAGGFSQGGSCLDSK